MDPPSNGFDLFIQSFNDIVLNPIMPEREGVTLWGYPVPFIVGKLRDNTASVGRRKNYPYHMVHFISFLGIKLYGLSR